MIARLPLLLPLALLACGQATPRQGTAVQTVPPAASSGLDPRAMARTVAAASRLPRLRSMIVVRDGVTVAEHRFNGGPSLDRPVNIKSAPKSALSALVGIAIARDVLAGVDQPVVSVLGSDAPASPDPRLARVTVGHLLSMRAGLERTSGENYGRWVSSPNWVRYALSRPFVDEPGGAMLYSTGSTHLLSAMLTRASGRSTHALAREWLGGPLGIEVPVWPRDPQGVYFGGNDMLMSPRALARFGELYRTGGTVGGRRVVPAAWIVESWKPRTVSPWSGGEYGYGWFVGDARGHPVRFAWGYGGQMLYILPDLRLTVVMTSDATGARDREHIDALNGLLAEEIVPAAEKGAAAPIRRAPGGA